MAWLLLKLIRGYKLLLSPLLGSQCRFHPTCSDYTTQAIQTHGPWRGSWLGIKRIFRCQPLSGEGGIDPIPEKKPFHENEK